MAQTAAQVHDIRNYIVRGKLWQAFAAPVAPVPPIDEIDKADIEFPHDLPPEALRATDPDKVIPPLHGALLKSEQDLQLFERLAFLARRQRC